MEDFTVNPDDWHVNDFKLLLSPVPGGTLQEYNLAEWINKQPDPRYHKKNFENVRMRTRSLSISSLFTKMRI